MSDLLMSNDNLIVPRDEKLLAQSIGEDTQCRD